MAEYNTNSQEDAAHIFAKHIVSLSYEKLPSGVIDITKKGIIDTLGVILAASGITPDLKMLMELIKEVGGKEESTILGFGYRVPAWNAGYVNGLMSHLMDYDDLHPLAAHINAPVFPAALAIAERQGRITGKEFITATAAGVDLLCRLTLATGRGGHDHQWNPMPVAGVFGATAACGKLLELDEDKMVNALGIAFTQAAGTMQAVYDVGSDIRGMLNGVPGEVGIRAALMAQIGCTGVRNIFDGQAGLINVYFGGKCNRSVLIGNLGNKFPALNDGFKPWPACGFTHPFIDATLQLVQENDIHPDNVQEIIVSVGDITQNLCEPLDERRKPPTPMNAKFSIPFTVAVAVAHREVVLGDFLPSGIEDEAALELAQRVSYLVDPDYNWGAIMPPGKVEIRTRDGKKHSLRIDIPYGNPQKPLSWEALIKKFRDCAFYSAKPLPQENVDKAIEMLTHLDEVADVSSVLQMLR